MTSWAVIAALIVGEDDVREASAAPLTQQPGHFSLMRMWFELIKDATAARTRQLPLRRFVQCEVTERWKKCRK